MGSVFRSNMPPLAKRENVGDNREVLGQMLGTVDFLGNMAGYAFDDSSTGIAFDRLKIWNADPDRRAGEMLYQQGGPGKGMAIGRAPSPDAMGEAAWRISEHYREDLPYDDDLTEKQHAERARQYDERQIRSAELAAYDPSVWEMVGGFGAAILGSAPAAETLVPLGFGLRGVLALRAMRSGMSARKASIAAGAAVGALEGGAGATLALPIIQTQRRYMGDPMSMREMVLDVSLSAFGGKVIGSIGGAVGRTINPDDLTTFTEKQQIIKEVARQEQALRDTGDFIPPEEATTIVEENALRRANDLVRENPVGAPDNPLVQITPGGIEGTIIERGGFKNISGVEMKGSGYGLVKFIWRHGEESPKPRRKQVKRSDVVAFPRIIREFEAQNTRNNGSREWVVERDDGEWVVYIDAPFTWKDGKRRVVSIHVLDEENRGIKILSPRRVPASRVAALRQDTSEETLKSSGSRATGETILADNKLSLRRVPASRVAALRQDTSEETLKSSGSRATDRITIADNGDEYNIKVEIAQLRDSEVLTLEELDALQTADDGLLQAASLGKAIDHIAVCIGRKS